MSMRQMPVVGIVLALSICGCRNSDGDGESFAGVGGRPEELPTMLNKDLPFRYPPSLYARKVQANVTLRLYIDKEGQVVSESTHVAETSTFAPLDSAAVRGSRDLRFIPAKTRGVAVPVSILFPVYFRHPEAAPLPGDTVLRIGNTPTAAQPDTVKSTTVKPASSKAGASATSSSSSRAKSAPKKGTAKKR
jgi:TonB family protein